jgi:hypothetical protein
MVRQELASQIEAKKLVIKTGENTGKHPSVASLYRALAEAESAETAAVEGDLPRRPTPVRIRRPEDPLTPEEIDLRQRLVAQRAELPTNEDHSRR